MIQSARRYSIDRSSFDNWQRCRGRHPLRNFRSKMALVKSKSDAGINNDEMDQSIHSFHLYWLFIFFSNDVIGWRSPMWDAPADASSQRRSRAAPRPPGRRARTTARESLQPNRRRSGQATGRESPQMARRRSLGDRSEERPSDRVGYRAGYRGWTGARAPPEIEARELRVLTGGGSNQSGLS